MKTRVCVISTVLLFLACNALSQTSMIRKFPGSARIVSMNKINNQWHWTGYLQSSQGWKGIRVKLDNSFSPAGNVVGWDNGAYYEALTSHKMNNGHIMTVGCGYLFQTERHLYFMEQDTNGVLLSAHKYVDPTTSLNIVNYAHSYNNAQTRLLIYYQNLSTKGMACFDLSGNLIWSKYLSPGNKAFRVIRPSSDGGWFAAADLSVSTCVNNDFDFLLVKLDSTGNITWSHRYGYVCRDEIPYDIHENTDGTISLVGSSAKDTNVTSVPRYCSILHISAAGNLLWSKTLSQPGGGGVMAGYTVSQLPDHRYICAGYHGDSINFSGILKMFMLQIDSTGNIVDGIDYGTNSSLQMTGMKIFDVNANSVSLFATDSYSPQIIVTDNNYHPPCFTSTFSYDIHPFTYSDNVYPMSTPSFTLVRDTLIPPDTSYIQPVEDFCCSGITCSISPSVTITNVFGSSCTSGKIKVTLGGTFNFYPHLELYDGLNNLVASANKAAGATSHTFSNLSSGKYTVKVFDQTCCEQDFDIQVKCPKPTSGLVATNITKNSAKVNWTTVSCAAGYKVQYRKQGTTAWTKKTISSNIGFKSLTGLTPSTIYEWRVQTNCLNSNPAVYSVFTPILSFTTLAMREGEPTTGQPAFAFSIDAISNLNISPNPSSEILNINFESDDDISPLQIINVTGQIILQKELKSTEGIYAEQLNISDLSSGIYILQIRSDNGFVNKKFVKE